jgi:hypothetical protein
MDRRGFLSLCAVGPVAGCSRFQSTPHQPASSEAVTVTDTTEERYRRRVDLEFGIEDGTFASTVLSPAETETVEVNVSVTDGVLDVWTLPESDFGGYEQGEKVEPIEQLSQTAMIAGASLSGDIEPGEYRVVLDNTPAFGAEPDGVATGTGRLERRLLSPGFFSFQKNLESSGVRYEQLSASEDRKWWLVQYRRREGQDQEEAALTVQEILLLYAESVPKEGTDHSGLRVAVEEPDAEPTLLEASAPLARAFNRGELDEQAYFQEVSRTAR